MSMTPGELIELANQLLIVAGRIPGVITVTGPPANTLGAVGSSAFWAEERTWYGPKTAEGWPPGVVVTQGPDGLSAKQIVINAGLLPPGATDTQFATWLADAQIAKVQPLVDAAAAARDGAQQALTDTEALADQIIEDSTPDITVTAVAGAPGTPASVVKGGTLKAPTFKVTVPRGADGGDGLTPNVSAEVTMIATGQPAVVTRSGPDSAPVFTFQLPRQEDGEDGREVEIQAGATHLQWRYVGDATWINLYAKADLQVKGDKGDAFEFDAKPANLASRAAYDAEPEGFTVLVMDTGTVYARIGATPGVWSDGFPFGQTQNAILVALSGLSAAPGLLYQEDGESFSKRAIGAAADTDVLDRQSADGRYRRQGQSVAMGDITGLAGALDEKANAAAVLAALGDKQDALGFTPADAAAVTAALETKADLVGGKVPASQLPAPPTVPGAATAAEIWAATDTTKIVTAKALLDALTPQALTISAGVVTPDFNQGINFGLLVTSNITLANPLNESASGTGIKLGRTGGIGLRIDSVGGRTISFGSRWRHLKSAGAATLPTAANAYCTLYYECRADAVYYGVQEFQPS